MTHDEKSTEQLPAEIDLVDDAEKRTTAVGLFHFAESYRTCAEALMRDPPKSLRFDDPLWFLAYHALELYLKAYLRRHGATVVELRSRFLHSLTKAWDAAQAYGLTTTKDPRPLFLTLDSERRLIALRYIVTGFNSRPDAEELMNFIEEVREAVHVDLATAGLPVRQEDPAENGWTRDS